MATFGYTTLGTSETINNILQATFTDIGYVGGDGVVTKMSAYLRNAGGGAQNVQMALYTKTGSTYNLLANTNTTVVTSSSDALYDFTFQTNPTTNSSTTYYLLIQGNSSTLEYKYNANGATNMIRTFIGDFSWPSSFSATQTVQASAEMTTYATYTTGTIWSMALV